MKTFFRKVMLGLLALVIVVLSREIINELRWRQLDPWERMFEVIGFHRGSRPPYPEWDTTAEDWEDRGKFLMRQFELSCPPYFENIRDKEVALEAGAEILVQLQNEERFLNFAPTTVFFNTELNQWFIVYFYLPPRDEFISLGADALTIVIDGENGCVVKVFVS